MFFHLVVSLIVSCKDILSSCANYTLLAPDPPPFLDSLSILSYPALNHGALISMGDITWVPLPSGFQWVEQKLGTGVERRAGRKRDRGISFPFFLPTLLPCSQSSCPTAPPAGLQHSRGSSILWAPITLSSPCPCMSGEGKVLANSCSSLGDSTYLLFPELHTSL